MKSLFVLLITGVYATTGADLFARGPEDVFTYRVGTIEVALLSEGQQTGKSNILIGATPEMLQRYTTDGTFSNATNAFLIRTPEKTILADTGYGRNLFDNMQSFGITAKQINAVLITHMHGDHIGGLLRDGKVVFPDAEIYLPKPEYDYWMSDEAMNRVPENRRGGFSNARAVISAYRDKLRLFLPEELGTTVVPLLSGIRGIAAYGHTPGHTMYLVESGKDKLLIWGDLTHAMAVQMPCPQVAVTYDVNPEQAVVSRQKTLEYVSKNKIPVAGMHVPYPGMGSVTKGSGEGYVFTPFEK